MSRFNPIARFALHTWFRGHLEPVDEDVEWLFGDRGLLAPRGVSR